MGSIVAREQVAIADAHPRLPVHQPGRPFHRRTSKRLFLDQNQAIGHSDCIYGSNAPLVQNDKPPSSPTGRIRGSMEDLDTYGIMRLIAETTFPHCSGVRQNGFQSAPKVPLVRIRGCLSASLLLGEEVVLSVMCCHAFRWCPGQCPHPSKCPGI